MEPTAEEMAVLSDAESLYGWVGLLGDIGNAATPRGALHSALGFPESAVDIASITVAEFDEVIALLTLPPEDGGEPRPFTPGRRRASADE